MKLPPRMRSAKVRKIIEVVVAEGKGVEGDPVRLVVYHYDLKGELLAVHDAWGKTQEQEG